MVWPYDRGIKEELATYLALTIEQVKPLKDKAETGADFVWGADLFVIGLGEAG